ncbi:Uma2 family endonuclease [Larkinella sp. VNQ87]|uniref:Uma2 family endonuclease n=1 Tax=Larkinella sp. VNQ87 TaxID=3400921 RepID=UPI003C083392
MITSDKKTSYTAEEYFALEEKSEIRHEYYQGGLYAMAGSQVIKQPRVIVEVLSKSTALTDRSFKWQRYRKVPSLWYYILVDQYSTTVELFSRIEETDEWINSLYENRDDIIVFPRLNIEVSLQAIYDGLELHSEEVEGEEGA